MRALCGLRQDLQSGCVMTTAHDLTVYEDVGIKSAQASNTCHHIEQFVPIENVDPWKLFCIPPSQRQSVGRALWALCKALAK